MSEAENGTSKSEMTKSDAGKAEAKASKGMNPEEQSAQKAEDAITLLKNDHRTVEQMFESFEKASRRSEKQKIARQVCNELIIHALLEEEIFYPACREFVDDDLLDEAQVEHDGAKMLILEIMEGSPAEAFYDAKVKVLAEYIKHHVQEEEKRNEGIFAKAKSGGLDAEALGRKIAARKAELMKEAQSDQLERPQPVSFQRALPQAEGEGHGARRSTRSSASRADERRFDDEDDRTPRNARTRIPDRDEQGRFLPEDDHQRRSSRRYANDDEGRRPRYAEEDDRYPPRRASREDDDRENRSRSRDDDRYSPTSYRSDNERRAREDDDDDRPSSRARSDQRSRADDDDDDERGQSGWYGDRRGHAEAARRGWDNRR